MNHRLPSTTINKSKQKQTNKKKKKKKACDFSKNKNIARVPLTDSRIFESKV